ncbi:type II toxin-antitoxin system prevent-host-death family antitoxin [Burkholderiaceae bacterium DAT-1]|nr:type II toxin-antitoxin system prevent-host-death family antitoxin [Burkholderiaceae bacterium DAT-1]
MRTMTSAHAQNHFGEMLDVARREPVTITRRGRPVAVVVSIEDLRDLAAGRALDALTRYRQAADQDQREAISETDLLDLIANAH